MDREVIWVDTLAECQEACARLAACARVAVDLEGTDLAREGGLCLLQAVGEEGPVYLFDVRALGPRGFEAGLLELLASERPEKLLFDPRSDADALRRHGAQLRSFLDLQVLYCWATGKSGQYVPGMSKATGELTSLPAPFQERLMELKEEGRGLFVPELGGCEDVWERRPLPEVLKQYSACDAVVLLHFYDEWAGNVEDLGLLVRISQKRLERHLAAPPPTKGATRDFPVPADFRTVFASVPRSPSRAALQDALEQRYGPLLSLQYADGSKYAFAEFASQQTAQRAVSSPAAAPFQRISWPTRVEGYIAAYLSLTESAAPPSSSAPAAAPPGAGGAAPAAAAGG